jgi:hypothetical protein
MNVRDRVACCVVLIITTLSLPNRAMGISWEDLERAKKVIRKLTEVGALPYAEEKRQIAEKEKQYRDMQKMIGVSAVGATFIDGLYPSAPRNPGTLVNLTFEFLDPATGEPTSGPAVASVQYFANLDPDSDDYVFLGASLDAGSDFSLPFLVIPFEPMIKSIPFDPSGAPITIVGLEGQNVALGLGTALQFPEPSGMALLALGVVALGRGALRIRA